MSTQFQTNDKVRAVFKPLRTDDLRPGMEAWVGHEDIWECNGMADPEGKYAGQAAFQVATSVQLERHQQGVLPQQIMPPCTWIPECDLQILEIITLAQHMAQTQPEEEQQQ